MSYLPWVAGAAAIVANVLASVHVVLYKQDSPAAIGWIGVIWLAPAPGLGTLLYFLFGINRIQRRARRLWRRRSSKRQRGTGHGVPGKTLAPSIPAEAAHLTPLAQLIGAVTRQPLSEGNRVQPLHNGDQAYPAMLDAIAAAKKSVALGSYIFKHDRLGLLFVEALRQAVARGVHVRVMIDDFGGHYTWHSILTPLRAAGVPAARFLPKLLPRYFTYANLCNHRKILVVDGHVGFTGGLNIAGENCLDSSGCEPTRDVHFRIDGPVVARLQEVFVEDWEFCSGELLKGERWFPNIADRGPVPARGISSGPDEDLEKLHLVLLGALSCARDRVQIVTPYFLPDASLISALNIAALRGVRVDILLPVTVDLRVVRWAAMAQMPQLLEHGCRVWLTRGAFNHTKLMLVDGIWTLLGSGNWDPRSLRLNFEFDLECYDRELAATLESQILKDLEQAQPLTLAGMNDWPFLIKVRNGVAHLLAPYL